MDTRIRLEADSLSKLFNSTEKAGLSVADIARITKVHSRTVRDWRRGKYTIPKHHFASMLQSIGDKLETYIFEEVPAGWHTSEAGSYGGRAYMAKYGALGTTDSRSAGGHASYQLRKNRADDIFERKQIHFPHKSQSLAEFVGIMIGDGSVGEYQASVALDIVTDKEYAVYVAKLFESLFKMKPIVQLRPKQGCIVIVMSSVVLANHLVDLGLPRGRKLRAGLDIPEWITNSQEYSAACIRGIFDTDGSVFQEIHKYKDKRYAYCRAALVSSSPALRMTVAHKLIEFGIHAMVRGNRCVSLERFTDIEKYFRIVGSSNPKHLNRWAAFGGVG